jgi:hypothetical protein
MHLTSEYLMDRVVTLSTGCWQWNHATSREGYGVLRINGKLSSARRAFWEMFVGEIPDGQVLCHRKNRRACVGKSCCNPAHLILREKRGPAWETCPRGHRLLPSNVTQETSAGGKVVIRCRRCRLEYWNARRSSRKVAADLVASPPS